MKRTEARHSVEPRRPVVVAARDPWERPRGGPREGTSSASMKRHAPTKSSGFLSFRLVVVQESATTSAVRWRGALLQSDGRQEDEFAVDVPGMSTPQVGWDEMAVKPVFPAFMIHAHVCGGLCPKIVE